MDSSCREAMTRAVGVHAISDADGSIRVLAIDHRDSMRQFLSPNDPAGIDAAQITELKIDIVGALVNKASGVMLEPEFSIPQVIDAGLVPPHVGVIAALESQGYLSDPAASVTSVLDGWSPTLALAAGASMVKLLLPYRPGSTTASAQEAVARECNKRVRRRRSPVGFGAVAVGRGHQCRTERVDSRNGKAICGHVTGRTEDSVSRRCRQRCGTRSVPQHHHHLRKAKHSVGRPVGRGDLRTIRASIVDRRQRRLLGIYGRSCPLG